MDKKNMVDALNLDRVKDIMGLKIKPNHVLIEVVKKEESSLILPEHAQAKSGKMVVIKTGTSVTQVNVGDIIVDIKFAGDIEFATSNKRNIIIADAYNIILATSPENYE